jgi:hypothetical protein
MGRSRFACLLGNRWRLQVLRPGRRDGCIHRSGVANNLQPRSRDEAIDIGWCDRLFFRCIDRRAA